MDRMSAIGLASVLCLLGSAGAALPQEPAIPPKIEKFLEHCETSRRGAILNLEHRLRGLHRQSPATREVKARIADLEQQVRLLRSNARPVVPPIAFPPQVGAIGRLPRLSCHVEQVVSDDELLVRCSFPVVVTTVRRFQPRRETVVRPMELLIRGLPTREVHEGSDMEMLQVFEVASKETYQTVDGRSKHVLVLTPFDMKSIQPYFVEMAKRNR